MSTSPVVPAAATAGTTTSTNGLPSGQSLNNMFLQLLVAQLQNQDPTSPVDPSQFVGQLAQFSELSEVTSIYQLLQQVVPTSGSGSGTTSGSTSGTTSSTNAANGGASPIVGAVAAAASPMLSTALGGSAASSPNFSAPALSALAGNTQGVF